MSGIWIKPSAGSPSLCEPFSRVDWARKRLADIEAEHKSFAKRQEDAVSVDVQGQSISIAGVTEGTQDALKILIGEFIYNLRCALDYLVFQLAWLDSGSPKERTQFPIETVPKNFAGRRNTYLEGISDVHVAAIEALQPYNGCDWTAHLRDLSNSDKHKMLTFAPLTGEVVFDRGPLARQTDGASTRTGDMKVKRGPTVHVAFPDGTPILSRLPILQHEVRAVLQAFEPDFQR